MGNTPRFDLIEQIIYEAKSYSHLTDIEKMATGEVGLIHIPAQPLYMTLKNSSSDIVASFLPKLSAEQRQFMLDMDLWKKDVVDVDSFDFWIETYAKCTDEVIVDEFVKNEDFLFYLKSRINIWTFDAEEPEYPDHDYYFLTDDGLLLVEYSEDYANVHHLKNLIRRIYGQLGVENAYSLLFKLVNDNFSLLQEDLYRFKQDRLRDYGILDYYEAKEKLHPFHDQKQLDFYVQKLVKKTGQLEAAVQNQTLHLTALTAFQDSGTILHEELKLIKNEDRFQFLHFSFVRLVNATLVINDALKASSMEMSEIGRYTKMVLNLGLDHIRKTNNNIKDDESIFDYFDMLEVYKVGHSLVMLIKSKVKKVLNKTVFAQDEFEYFLGNYWNIFLDDLFNAIPKVKSFGAGLHPKEISNIDVYAFLELRAETFVEIMPYFESFWKAFEALKKDSKILDEFYLNYEVENIDIESILITGIINFHLGQIGNAEFSKMGVTIKEFKQFVNDCFEKRGEEFYLEAAATKGITDLLDRFTKTFGMYNVKGINEYLYGILSEHLSGYEFNQLSEDDYKHVGGPILLNYTAN